MNAADTASLSGVRLSVDVGKARVGLAATDPSAILATPVQTLKRDERHHRDIARIVRVAEERNAIRVYVGDPKNMRGEATASTQDAADFAQLLADQLAEAGLFAQVRMVDERLSTVSASRAMSQMGRSTRKQRSVIDQAAAVEILEHALDLEKIHGADTGRLVLAASTETSPEETQ